MSKRICPHFGCIENSIYFPATFNTFKNSNQGSFFNWKTIFTLGFERLSQDWWWRSIFFLPQVAALQLMHFVQEFPECTTTNLINLHFSTTNVPCHSESYLLGQFHLDFFIDRHGRMLLKLLWPDCWTYGDNSRLFRIIIRTLFMDNWTSNRVQLQPNEIAQFCWAFSDFSKASYYQHLIRFWSGRSQKKEMQQQGELLSVKYYSYSDGKINFRTISFTTMRWMAWRVPNEICGHHQKMTNSCLNLGEGNSQRRQIKVAQYESDFRGNFRHGGKA